MSHEEAIINGVHAAFLSAVKDIKENTTKPASAGIINFLRTCNIRTVYMLINDELAAVRVKDFTDEALMQKDFLQGLIAFTKLIVGVKVFTGEILSTEKLDDIETYKLDREHLYYKGQSQLVNCINVKFTASVHDTTFLGNGVNVSENAVIGTQCIIGDDTVVCKLAVIMDNVIIGDNCTIQGGVYLEGNNFIGDKVVIGSNVRVADGVGIEEHMTIPSYANLPATPDGKLYGSANTNFANIGDSITVTLYKCEKGVVWVAVNLKDMMTISELSNLAVTDKNVSALRSGFNTILHRAHQLESAE